PDVPPLLAGGPRGRRVLAPHDGGPAAPGAGTAGAAWDATVVGSVFRRGAVEVTVDVALPGADGPARLVALAAPAGSATRVPGGTAPAPGERVRGGVDPAGWAGGRGWRVRPAVRRGGNAGPA